ncbi:MAG: TraR/DksA C4-type zinc finger protein [Actinomycetota bacterium]|jgi:RNA polymerase-binding transcription factor DksA|nr:TraR/DksA C4-type zinc finger protein [Actinomycetota bacterium]
MSTQIDIEHFRARLEEEQQKVQNAIGYLQKENPRVPEEITGDLAMGPGDNHLADLATETVDREIDYTLEENSGNVLREIEAALKRIDDGTFGVCTVCGRPVEPERLEYLPWATLCADDARGSRG